MTVGDFEGKRVVEPAPTVTRCNAASISREHNTSPGLWRDSKGQHDASCVLTPWAEDCQSIKFSLNISKSEVQILSQVVYQATASLLSSIFQFRGTSFSLIEAATLKMTITIAYALRS